MDKVLLQFSSCNGRHLMSDEIVTRLQELASNYKTTEFEFMHADYETVCEASSEIERLRAELSKRIDYQMVQTITETVKDLLNTGRRCHETTLIQKDLITKAHMDRDRWEYVALKLAVHISHTSRGITGEQLLADFWEQAGGQ